MDAANASRMVYFTHWYFDKTAVTTTTVAATKSLSCSMTRIMATKLLGRAWNFYAIEIAATATVTTGAR